MNSIQLASAILNIQKLQMKDSSVIHELVSARSRYRLFRLRESCIFTEYESRVSYWLVWICRSWSWCLTSLKILLNECWSQLQCCQSPHLIVCHQSVSQLVTTSEVSFDRHSQQLIYLKDEPCLKLEFMSCLTIGRSVTLHFQSSSRHFTKVDLLSVLSRIKSFPPCYYIFMIFNFIQSLHSHSTVLFLYNNTRYI